MKILPSTAAILIGLILGSGLAGCGKSSDKGSKRPRIAYMGNAIAPFWSIGRNAGSSADGNGCGWDEGAGARRMPMH